MNNDILKLKLKRVDPVKYATISALLTVALFVVIILPFFLLFSALGMTQDLGAGAAMLGGGIFFMIIGIIFYGVIVFVATLILTSILNFILKKTGGLDIDFEKAGIDISQIGQDRRIEQ